MAARDGEAVILALAADHHVRDVEGLRATCAEALAAARDGWIVTFGVAPTHPSADYGYLAPGRALDATPGVRQADLRIATHWVIARGRARVTAAGRTHALEAHESLSIPAGPACSLEDVADDDLEIIEVRTDTQIG